MTGKKKEYTYLWKFMRYVKSAGYGFKAKHKYGYPADGYYYGLCDICGRKMRVNQMKMTYGTRGTLLVCPNDYEDPHPQDYIKSFRERKQPKLVRSERQDQFRFADSVDEIENEPATYPSGRVPGAPTGLTVTADSSTSVELRWDMSTTEPGSGAICGFKIERESPEGGGFSVIVNNSDSPSLYYKDTGLSNSTQYNYRVSAINKYGTGSASNEAKDTTEA